MTLWRLTHARACCGLVVEHGRVTERAPYLSKRVRIGDAWADVKRRLIAAGWHGAPVMCEE